ncbi:MAG: ThuA domain-containing protein [Planctomycetaceae bacterium]|nr:ThuA domain-containing protein [Planctomycetaceae bacterium]
MRHLFLALALSVSLFVSHSADAAEKLKLLIIDGQNNHNWQATTPILTEFLTKTGRFDVSVATTPPKNSPADAWSKFNPKFSDYDVVLSNYNGEEWPENVKTNLEQYVSGGGGLVIVHAANNAFPNWPAWNQMIGLGWRNNKYGKRVIIDDNGKKVLVPAGEGPGAGHGRQHEYAIRVRDTQHPVTHGMPAEWLHTKDELYHGQRGPGQSMNILATAYSDPETGGTDAHEPMIWWIPYGKGKVFTTLMGHADYSMQCVGFQSVVARGSEWAATGEVTLPLPKNFPTAEKLSSVE